MRATSCGKEFVFNLDEFAVVLGSCKKWTWHPRAHVGGVAIRSSKECFTCTVVTSADGSLVELQIIWKGATDLVHANTNIRHPKIYQDHQPASHFQNGATFARLASRLIDHVKALRRNRGQPSAPAIVLVDAAPQHSGDFGFSAANIRVVEIPKKMTHIFQPADQYVIAGLKRKMSVAWDAFVEQQFAQHSTDVAIAELKLSNKPMVRSRMYSFLASAVDELGSAAVFSSWEVTGINRAMWTEVPSRVVHADAVCDRIQSECDCGQLTAWFCEGCDEAVCHGCRSDHVEAWCPNI